MWLDERLLYLADFLSDAAVAIIIYLLLFKTDMSRVLSS